MGLIKRIGNAVTGGTVGALIGGPVGSLVGVGSGAAPGNPVTTPITQPVKSIGNNVVNNPNLNNALVGGALGGLVAGPVGTTVGAGAGGTGAVDVNGQLQNVDLGNALGGSVVGGLVGGPVGSIVGGVAGGTGNIDIGGSLSGLGGAGDQTDPIAQAQLPYLQDIFQRAQEQYNAGNFGRVAPLDPYQQQAYSQALGIAQNQLGTIAPLTQGALQFGLNGALDVNNNPYLQQAIEAAQKPTVEAFQRGIQSIGSAAARVGAYGGSRQGIVEGSAARDFGRTLADQAAQMSSQAYGQGLNTFGQTLALAPQTAQIPFNALGQLTNYGALGRSYSQAQLDQPYGALGAYSNLIGSPVPSQYYPQASPIQGALGGAATGAAIGSAIPGLGTGYGALIGGGLGLLGSYY